MVVVDLPLNNAGGGPAGGLGWPGDLRVGDFLAFELNVPDDSLIDEDVSYTLFGVEFFESLPGDAVVEHATLYNYIEDVDCPFMRECTRNHDCDDGEFCNGQETCSPEGLCVPGVPECDEDGWMCDEVDDECIPCDADLGDRKTVICHIPSWNFDAGHTIVVSTTSVPAHLEHGDSIGACPGDCVEEPPADGSVEGEE
jgi:hypothetical protein